MQVCALTEATLEAGQASSGTWLSAWTASHYGNSELSQNAFSWCHLRR